MPAVAEVQFKATGSSEVEGAFKSVGSAAGDTTTKIQQNSSAMKSVGQGMKSATSGIAQTATAFATLALSVVSTWRAYRDLGDAQLGVDRANFKVQKSTQAVANAQKLVAGLKAGMRKTDLETIAASSKIAARQEALNKKVHQNKITTKAARAEQDAINLSRSKVGSDKASELAKAEQDLKNKTEALGLATESAAQKQKHFNDSTQDFYLSLLPTAISTIATAVSGFESIKNVLGGGGGGLIGSLSGIGLVLGAGSLALLAYKNNWLGFRDAVGGVINWLKERFGVWKDTIAAVFDLIRKGDWGAAFNKIREAAVAFWADLKKQVPILTAVETIVNAIREGKWKYAFDTIIAAAELMWYELKQKVPFFAGAEVFIKQLFGGDLKGAFNTLAAGIKTGLETIFGKNAVGGFILKIQEMKATAVAEFGLMQHELTKKGGPFDLIQQGLAKLGSGDIVGGFSQIWTGIDKAIGIAIARINDWVKLNFGIDLSALNAQANAIGNKILDGIKAGLTFVARTWIDPILVALLDPQTWITGFIAMGGFFVKIGTALYTAIGTALGNAAKDPKGAATWWGDLGNAIWTGLTTWFTANLPGATKAMQAIAQSLMDGVEAAKIEIQNIGIAIWNQIIEGIRAFTGGAASPFGGALDALKKNPIDLPVKPIITSEGKTLLQTWTKQNPIELHTSVNTQNSQKSLSDFKNRVERQDYIAKMKLQTDKATQGYNQFKNKVESHPITVKLNLAWGPSSTNAVSKQLLNVWGGGKQHGYQSTVHRPTMFMAGEGGRPEDVTVRPRGSAQRGGSSGGGGSTHIIVSFEPQEFAQFIRYRINDNQGVVK